jgi:hypothetical protein
MQKPWDLDDQEFFATLTAILHIVYTTFDGRSAFVKTCQHRCQMLPRQRPAVFQPDFLITRLVLLQLQLRELVQYTNWECHRVMLFVLAQ